MKTTAAALATLILILLACSTAEKNETVPGPAAKGWTNFGPGGGGAVYCSTVNPSDPDNVFICCDMTGSYGTWDGGRSWRNFNLRAVVNDFEFDPGDSTTVYAATSALYRSRDKGRSWELAYPAPSAVTGERMVGDEADQSYATSDGMPDGLVLKVRVDPSDRAHLWLGLGPSRRPDGPRDSCRVLVSRDTAASWTVAACVPGREVLDIIPGSWLGQAEQAVVFTERGVFRLGAGGAEPLARPDSSGIIMATGGCKPDGGAVLYILTPMRQNVAGKVEGGIWRSADGGASWQEANNGLLEGWSSSGALPVFRTLAACEGDPDVLYLSCTAWPVKVDGQLQTHFGTLASKDGGASWQWSYRGSEQGLLSGNYTGYWKDRSFGIPWAGEPNSYGICPTRPEVCYLTDNRTLRTLDGGKHWEQVGSNDLPDSSATTRGMEGTTTYGVHFDPFDPQHFLITYADFGLFQTLDGGRSWQHAIRGVPAKWTNTCYWLEFDPAVKGRIYAAWSGAHDLPRTKMYYRTDRMQSYEGGVAVSEDGGGTWRASNSGLPAGTIPTHILLDSTGPDSARTLYICAFGSGVYKSVDSGASWQAADKGLGGNRHCLRMSQLPSGQLFLVVFKTYDSQGNLVPGALYTSLDKAESWSPVPLPAGVVAPNDLACDPDNPDRLYLAAWPQMQGDSLGGGGLWVSEDRGQSWKLSFNQAAYAFGVTVDNRSPQTLYLTTFNSALWRSDDRSGSWRRVEGFNFKWAHRAIPDPYDPSMLYVATFGGSLFHGPATGMPDGGSDKDVVNYSNTWRLRP